jgi:hypothetical protein
MAAFDLERKGDRNWTMMIAQPNDVTLDRFELVREEARRKKQLPAIARARFERFEEGACAQVLHVGPFSPRAQTSWSSTHSSKSRATASTAGSRNTTRST